MTVFAYDLDPQRAVQLGLIVLQSDETIERDFHRLIPAEVELLVSRVPSGTEVSLESLGEMEGHLSAAAALFPQSAAFAAVGYGCTSGTATIGADRIARLVRNGTATPEVSEPISALIAACGALGVTRLGLLSPYAAPVSQRLREVLSEAGVETPVFGSFDEPLEARVARISPEATFAAACALAQEDGIDALFLSCTNLRTLNVIDRLESETGLPVLSSNQVLAWHLLQLAETSAEGPGRIWSA